MVDNRKPNFRFNPNAYLPGRVFEQSKCPCDVCGKECIWRYTSAIYTAMEEPANVCACCIADGNLVHQIGCGFHDVQLVGADAKFIDEFYSRTPHVDSYNPFIWPVLDGCPLAFLNYGDEKSNLWKSAEVNAAIEAAYDAMGRKSPLSCSYTMLFKEIDGNRYKVVIDLD